MSMFFHPPGSVIKSAYTQFTGTNTVSLTADADTVFTDLTVNITPTSTSSIIKLEAHIFGEFADSSSGTASTWNHTVFFFRDSTKLGQAVAGNRNVGISSLCITFETDDNSTPEAGSYFFIDSPATTSQITYKCGINSSNNDTFYLNQVVDDSADSAYGERGVSTIFVTEIAQ
jgi:hypothetical protein